jgi:hypothetical protein
MDDPRYRLLRELSRKIAATLAQPVFYRAYAEDVRRSEYVLANHGLVRQCRDHLDKSLLECAHGICHCEAVARDAGAIVMIEGRERGLPETETTALTEAAIVAGLLHDIKRREADHAVRGSLEADRILTALGVDERKKNYITYAIRSHEAFKAVCDLEDKAGCLVSDALYDADKFRWGPENFTTTVWTMVQDKGTPPRRLYEMFPEKMKGIEAIKYTFRTGTGRCYGPEIIEQGITIGNAIYREMSLMMGQDS